MTARTTIIADQQCLKFLKKSTFHRRVVTSLIQEKQRSHAKEIPQFLAEKAVILSDKSKSVLMRTEVHCNRWIAWEVRVLPNVRIKAASIRQR